MGTINVPGKRRRKAASESSVSFALLPYPLATGKSLLCGHVNFTSCSSRACRSYKSGWGVCAARRLVTIATPKKVWRSNRATDPETMTARSPLGDENKALHTEEENSRNLEVLRNTCKYRIAVWHLTMTSYYAGLIFSFFIATIPLIPVLSGKIPPIGGPFKYLTHINLWLQLLFFGLQLAADLGCVLKERIQKFSSYVFTILVFPTSALIVTTFWPIYAIDRNLIYPEYLDSYIPWYLNQLWHTAILLWVLCELYIVNHDFPSSLVAFITILLFSTMYTGWVFYIYGTTGHWVYTFLEHLSPLQLALFFTSAIFWNFGLHLAGKYLSYSLWSAHAKLE